MGDKYRPGDHYITCAYSGFKILKSEAKKTWDGHWVRKDLWEPRQPQDSVRGKIDSITVDDPRSQWESDTFLTTNEVTADDL